MNWEALLFRAVETAIPIITFVAGLVVNQRINAAKIRESRQAEERALRRSRMVEPIERFVDDQLEMISAAYWIFTDTQIDSQKNDREAKERASRAGMDAVRDRLNNLRNREASVRARVKALGDPKLMEAFQQFCFQFFNMRSASIEGGFGAGRAEMDKAIVLGADVLQMLWTDRRK